MIAITEEIKRTTDAQTLFEEQYPETAKEFKRIQQYQYETFCRKALDYGMSNISVGGDITKPADKQLALTGIWFRMADKINRLKQLVALGNQTNVKTESTLDTYQDLSNYSIIAQLVESEVWGK